MSSDRKLTIVVPAFNEERHIAETLRVVSRSAARNLADYEIIAVDDGSRDATGKVMDDAAKDNPRIRVIHQPTNRGVGAAYLKGLDLARFESITVVPGDNAFAETTLDNVFRTVGTAPLIVSYRVNMEVRTPLRRTLSVICTLLMRIITGHSVRDAHSMFVFPVDVARTLSIQPGYGYHIESLGRLLVLCPQHVEVPAFLNPQPDLNSGVMRPRVVFLLGTTMLRLVAWRIATLFVSRPKFAGQASTTTAK